MQKLAIIIPAYNESKSIEESINKLLLFLKDVDFKYEVIVVDDGSKDNTKEIITNLKGITALSYTPNRGKGGAVKYGMEYAYNQKDIDYMVFMDADLSTDLKALNDIEKMFDEGSKFVVGSRYDKESNIVIYQPLKRRIISKLSRIIIASMFHFGLKDTQCGFKGMKKDIAELLLNKSVISNFAFDVEFLYIAKLNKYDFKSLPVVWKDDRDSKVAPIKSSIKFFKDLFKIKKHKKQYIA